jgi:hypothetical protein
LDVASVVYALSASFSVGFTPPKPTSGGASWWQGGNGGKLSVMVAIGGNKRAQLQVTWICIYISVSV